MAVEHARNGLSGTAAGRRSLGVAARRAGRAGVHPPDQRGRINPRCAHRDAGPEPDHHAMRARGIPAARRRVDRARRAGRLRRRVARRAEHSGPGDRPGRGATAGARRTRGARRGRRRHCRSAVEHRRTRPRAGRRHHAAHGRRAAGRDSRRGRTDIRRRGDLDRVRHGPRTVHRPAAAAE